MGEGEVDGESGVTGGVRTLRCGGVGGVCRVGGGGKAKESVDDSSIIFLGVETSDRVQNQ